MQSIIVVIPYFGKFNSYFNLFLKSIEYNSTVDFLIITDDKRNFDYPSNVKVVYSSFEEESHRMTSYFDFDATCGTPYKICDYKPFLGEIYKEYTKGYDFCGWCHTDIILGNIRKFISDNVLNEYSKINYSPHFSLIKNDGVINDTLLNCQIYDDVWNYREVLSFSNSGFYFDEFNGLTPTLERNNIRCYDCFNFLFDVDFFDLNFYGSRYSNSFSRNCVKSKYIFKYDSGSLYCIDETENIIELLYVHFQKRDLDVLVSCFNHYYVIPNAFVDCVDNLSEEFSHESLNEESGLAEEYQSSKYNINQKQTFYQNKKDIIHLFKDKYNNN